MKVIKSKATGNLVLDPYQEGSITGARAPALYAAELDLRGADFHGCDFSKSDFHKARLDGCNLRGCTFRLAILKGANLDGADITGASFRCAFLTGVTGLVATVGRETADFEGAQIDLTEEEEHVRLLFKLVNRMSSRFQKNL